MKVKKIKTLFFLPMNNSITIIFISRRTIMLSLGRNPGEYIVIGGNIIVEVVSIDGCLRLAIDAPKEMTIERGENYEKTHPTPECIHRTKLLGGAKRKERP